MSRFMAFRPWLDRRARRRLMHLGIVAAALATPTCLLLAPGVPSNDPILDCFVAVRNPSAEAELGTAVPEEELFSRAEPFLAADGTPIRQHVLGIQCPQHFETVGAAEADWSRFANQRISQLGESGDPENVFARFPGEWCQVPGTLRCEESGEQVQLCAEGALPELPDAPLPLCPEPEPPPGDPCLEISCGGAAPCTSIGFGEVPLGDVASETVVVSNCGEAGAPEIDVIVDGTVDPVGQLADFAIPADPDEPGGDPPNTCHPAFGSGLVVDLAPGESCSFRVDFAPVSSGDHHAETTFPVSTQPERHRIELTGAGLPGTLGFLVGDLGALPTPALCFDAPADPCTPARILVATNAGPGAVTITSVRVESEDADLPTGIEVDPTVEAEPVVLGAGESLELAVRWCEIPDAATQADLVIDSNDPDQPTFVLRTGRLASCPPGS